MPQPVEGVLGCQCRSWCGRLSCIRRLCGRPLGDDGIAQAGEQVAAGVEELGSALARPGGKRGKRVTGTLAQDEEGSLGVVAKFGDESVGVAAQGVAGMDLADEIATLGALSLALERGGSTAELGLGLAVQRRGPVPVAGGESVLTLRREGAVIDCFGNPSPL